MHQTLKKLLKRTASAIALACALCACSADDGRTVIFAASSLAAVTDDIDDALEAGGIDPPEWVPGASSRLIAQVRDGARPDIVISADDTQLRGILGLGYVVVEEPRITNRLVLAVADGNPAQLTSIDDLSLDGPLIGLCAPEVPCGAAALRIAAEFGITIRPDTAEPNVRALAHKLANGELDAGLVYATDARSLGLQTIADARIAEHGDCSNPAVTQYGIAALAGSASAGDGSTAGTGSTAGDGSSAGDGSADEGHLRARVAKYLPVEALARGGFELGSCR
ncbi:MAG: substrate-binding domain-containing protein [Acidimicrobiaceae bacterium]|nr:substrate-binding domain-containing protein [Acidimicrobiaceae bacterium]